MLTIITLPLAFAFVLEKLLLVVQFPYISGKVADGCTQQRTSYTVINKSIVSSETYRRKYDYEHGCFDNILSNHEALE